LNWGTVKNAKPFASLLACCSRVGVFIENADAKSEDACLRKK
jgi:hypothetical protein